MKHNLSTGPLTMNSSDEDEIAERTWKRVSEPIIKDGFREGHEAGKNDSIQNGFNDGYSSGYKAGYHLGLKHGALNAMQHFDSLKPTAQHQQVVDGHRGNCQMCPKMSTGSVKLDMASAWDETKGKSLDDFKNQQTLANERIFEDAIVEWFQKRK